MFILNESIPSHEKIRNIIFDFGGVICDLDIKRTLEKFLRFGPTKPEFNDPPEVKSKRFEELVVSYEKGIISSSQFRDVIRNHYMTPPDDTAIDDTWNALLVGIPEERIRLLERVRNNYRIFLLSNSNEIHYLHYLKDFQQKYGYKDFSDIFEKSYFSYRLHMIKPFPELFEFVLKDAHLVPGETLFIDDTLKHVEGSRAIGINGYHLKIEKGETILDLFKKQL